jgi:DNA-binding NarL/FixJ family response regulator
VAPDLRAIHEGRQPRTLTVCDPDDSGPPRGAATPSAVARVLVAHGQAVVRAGFRALLERDRRVTVVAEAATGEEAVSLARLLGPDVVMIDSMVPGLDSIEATRQIRDESPAAVMMLIASERDERILGALRAGASGLLLAAAQPAELVRAVELLARGDVLLAPRLTRRLISELVSRPVPRCPDPDLVEELTAREREVVALVGHGLDNADIAERLVLSPATAKSHVSHAMLKIGATDRAKLVVFAYEAGLVLPRVDEPLAA